MRRGPGSACASVPLGDGVTDLDALATRRHREDGRGRRPVPERLRLSRGRARRRRDRPRRRRPARGRADPVNLGLLTPPGAFGADIAVGEGQGLGVPMCFGGPNLGVFAARQELVRRMPGRLVGQPSTSTGGAASSSRCRRASSTSAARRRRRTSAPTWRCARSWPPSTWPSWASTGSGASASSRRPRPTTRPRCWRGCPACGSATERPSSRSSRSSCPSRPTAWSSVCSATASSPVCPLRRFDRALGTRCWWPSPSSARARRSTPTPRRLARAVA